MKPSMTCYQCNPPRKGKHLFLSGMPVHIRVDCPPDVLYMINESLLQVPTTTMKKVKKVNKLKKAVTAKAKKVLKKKK